MHSRIGRAVMYGLGLAIMVGCMSNQVLLAALVPVPEIDGNSLSVGLAALSAGFLILRSRRRTK